MLHPGLDLDLLVPREDDPNVDVPRVRLLLPQEVVDPRLDVVAEPRGLKPLGREPVFFFRGSRGPVATFTFEPGDKRRLIIYGQGTGGRRQETGVEKI